MEDDIVITELTDESPNKQPSTEAAQNGESPILNSAPLKEFFYGKKADLTHAEIDDLNFIWSHYSREAMGPGEILGRIRDVERTLSSPPQGVTRLQHILSYVRLLSTEEDIQKQKSAYYG